MANIFDFMMGRDPKRPAESSAPSNLPFDAENRESQRHTPSEGCDSSKLAQHTTTSATNSERDEARPAKVARKAPVKERHSWVEEVEEADGQSRYYCRICSRDTVLLRSFEGPFDVNMNRLAVDSDLVEGLLNLGPCLAAMPRNWVKVSNECGLVTHNTTVAENCLFYVPESSLTRADTPIPVSKGKKVTPMCYGYGSSWGSLLLKAGTPGAGLVQAFSYVPVINIGDNESLHSFRQGNSVDVQVPDLMILNRTQARNGGAPQRAWRAVASSNNSLGWFSYSRSRYIVWQGELGLRVYDQGKLDKRALGLMDAVWGKQTSFVLQT
ncbi:hypothetical protein FOL47_002478 [Perkinsus chesapeaki]|uniref:Uncharacterized protein n=1 Tax=Perkinsus chesapeaki TaxID=330153 RepID=A0A7J6KRB1_PERCH|nr:hypothetical protein FOL47_002478 [Perkinsus chesapeaki]